MASGINITLKILYYKFMESGMLSVTKVGPTGSTRPNDHRHLSLTVTFSF